MGASESRPRLDDSDDAPKQGYHVVRVAAGSPAHLAGIEPFFDFCVGIDGVALDPSKDVDGDRNSSDSANPASSGSLAGLGAWKSLEEREGTRVILNVWSSKRQELREVPIIPSRAWSEASTAGSASSQPSLLGLSLRLCNPSLALSHVWHILEILEGSPAESAGLVPFGDFVIGWTGGTLKSEGDFYELVEAHVDRALRLYVYNSDYDHTREVIIVPNREWGGEGLLGCGVGYGLLHRIPKPQDRPAVPSDLDEDGGARTPQPASQSTQLSASNDSGPPRGPRSIADEQAGAPEPYRPGRGEHANGYDQSERGRGNGDEERDDDDDDDDDEMNRSGVTVSMRRDEDDEEDD